MSWAQIEATAREFKRAGVAKVRILGGEPFISREMAVESFRAVRKVYAGDDIHVVTSGHWGGTEQLVASRLDPVVELGLKHLMLSFDTFHIERFPIGNYERILKRTHELGVDAQLSIHYTSSLMEHLPWLVELKRRYPFQMRLLTVSKEGGAELLDDAELSAAGIQDFRQTLLKEPGVEITQEDSTCFRWTVFPSGQLGFCCKEHPKNEVGNLSSDSLVELRERLQAESTRNRLRVLDFAVNYDGELSWNPCLSCPLKAES